MSFESAHAEAQRLDAQDELAPFRDRFYRPPGQIYLDGNSLGLLSIPAEEALLRALDAWKRLGIGGWLDAPSPWFFLAEELARQTAPLIGAEPDEVIVTNSTTVNLHQLIATLFQPESMRIKILADELNFPSDLYALRSQLLLRGLAPENDLLLVRSRNGRTLDESDIVDAMTDEVRIALLPAVLYRSGQLLDIASLTEEAHRRGIVIGFDCSHSIGVIPHRLSEWGVDFAVWCSYKYLNGGPGAIGGLYLNRRHFGRAPGLAGWFSAQKERQFDLAPTLEPAWGAASLQIGSPPIFSMAPLQGSLKLFAQAGIDRVRQKSLRLTAYLMALVDAELADYGYTIANPREEARRGGHVALVHEEAIRIGKALKSAGVVPDCRPPDILRLAPVALYTSFGDCCEAVRRLHNIMEQRHYNNYPTGRDLVS